MKPKRGMVIKAGGVKAVLLRPNGDDGEWLISWLGIPAERGTAYPDEHLYLDEAPYAKAIAEALAADDEVAWAERTSAAAPELLAMLEDCAGPEGNLCGMCFHRLDTCDTMGRCMGKLARALIARVKG